MTQRYQRLRRRSLVAGGAGFLGSHLCERLLARGAHVVCLDNFHTGEIDNISHLMGSPRFELIRGDVCDPLHLDVDEIWNLACPASPIHYQTDPVRTIRTCVLGTSNLLELARQCQAVLFQASTSEVYGDPEQHPQPETYWGNVNPIGPRACYDEGKRCAETLCFDYHRQHGIRIKVARIFNTYGPRMHPRDGRVVSNFICQALTGEPITIQGGGLQTRSFCYVDDLIEGFIRFMGTDDACIGPVNIGRDEELTVRQLADIVLRLSGSSSTLIDHPRPVDDPRQRRPDLSTARRLFQWDPQIAVEEGIQRTIAYFRSLPPAVLQAP